MLIQQLIDLEKVRTKNLKFRTDLRDQVMDGWSVTQYMTVYEGKLLNKSSFKLKIEAHPVNAGPSLVITWLSNIAFHLRPIWL